MPCGQAGEWTPQASATSGSPRRRARASTHYTYRIKAINEHGVSERSRWFHIETLEVPVPAKPIGLNATATHDQVALTWDDPGDYSITGYVILRRHRYEELGAMPGAGAVFGQRTP